MTMRPVKHDACRVCGSSPLTPVVDLGPQYLQGSFVKPGRKRPSSRRIPTSLVRCDSRRDPGACGLLQSEYTVPPEALYATYWYRSGTNRTMRLHLALLVGKALELIGDRRAARVLDIGCNDGTLLHYYPKRFKRFGVDPCDIAGEVKSSATIVRDFFPSEELDRLTGGQPFDVITSIAMFYDLEDPVAFAKAVRRSLADDGVWLFEVSYMPTMLANTGYDTICHEHIEYYSLAVIENILARTGMKVVAAELNDTNGGSLFCAATRYGNSSHDRPERQSAICRLRKRELGLRLDTAAPYSAFRRRVHAHRTKLRRLLERLKARGATIHAYGASTKGNTLLQWCGIDRTIVDCAADRNPEKWGARTLGSGIPIVSEKRSRALAPDYYLILPWHFKREFLERERAALEAGTGFIFPLPEIDVVRAGGRHRRREKLAGNSIRG